MMTRREVLTRVSILLGGTVLGAQAFLSGCKSSDAESGKLLSTEQQALMDEIGETIIPTTAGSPGAKSVGIGAFADMIARDCYTEADQKVFRKGFDELDKRSKKEMGAGFVEASPEQRKKLLNLLDQEQRAYYQKLEDEEKKKDKAQPGGGEKPEPHYFRQMKEITLLGYFTSEPGCTKALRYEETPGKFVGDLPYKKGDRAWATN